MKPIEWREVTSPTEGARAWMHLNRPLVAIVSEDMGRLHMSVSHRDRVPTWEEMGVARDALLPEDAWLCVPFPPRRYWLNYDHRVLHLWAFKDSELQEQFRWEGEDAQRRGFGEPTVDPPTPTTANEPEDTPCQP